MKLPTLKLQIIIIIAILLLGGCSAKEQSEETSTKVKVGAEILIEKYLPDLEGKRVGLVMNPTARINGTHMLDTLLERNVDVTALFSPEHGFRGDRGAGEKIEDGIDQKTGLPVYSLYGKTRKPTAEMLKNTDILLFDIQDVGARFYTYNATLGNIIEAATEFGIKVWVLDRPNPAGGYVGGWILEEPFTSFVGAYPIPVAHGMTLGELGQMMIAENWLDLAGTPEYRVIEMEGWKHDMLWGDTKLPWIPPSPNLPEFKNAYAYLGTAFFEGTTLSEGRGTRSPFLILGDPNFSYHDATMQALAETYGVQIDSLSFTPKAMPGKAPNPDHEGVLCYGVEISIPDIRQFTDPVSFGLDLMAAMLKATPEADTISFLYKLAGTKDKITQFIEQSSPKPGDLWHDQAAKFKEKREPYLLYP